MSTTLSGCKRKRRTGRGRRALAWVGSLVLAAGGIVRGEPLRVAVIGDSLSAEYDALPNIPGIEDPTSYAAVTVPGWESRCWVEVLAALRPDTLDFGPTEPTLPGWNDLRFTGHRYNFAIPGFEASQYEDIVNSSLISYPQYFLFKLTLADALRHEVGACVVWIGANEFRGNYGYLYNGGDAASLIGNLRHDVGEILDFVLDQSPTLKVVVVNLPDPGASPAKQEAHPDPAKREFVSQAVALANDAIRELADARGLPVADVFSATRQLIEWRTNWIGPVNIYPGSHPDNHPRYAFTRDGLHPNTANQLEVARIIIAALNDHYGTAIPRITDSEALLLLGLDPRQPYLNWASDHGLATIGYGEDLDADGLVNLVEFVFDLDPGQRSASPLAVKAQPGGVIATYQPDPARSRFVNITPQWSTNLATWTDVPSAELSTDSVGGVTVGLRSTGDRGFLRLRVSVRAVE